MTFKLFDKIRIKGTSITGVIDAITDYKYRVHTNEGYRWISHWEARPLKEAEQYQHQQSSSTNNSTWHGIPILNDRLKNKKSK